MEQQNRTIKSFKNILMGSVSQIVQIICTFANRIVFVRCLSVEYLGVNGLFTNLISVLSLAELGLGTSIIYELYRSMALKDEDKTAALMKLYAKIYKIIGLIVAALGLLMLPFLDFLIASPPNIDEDIRIIFLIYLLNTVVTYFFAYKSSIISADQKSYIVSGISAFTKAVQAIVQIILLVITRDFILYLFVMVVMTLVNNIIVSIYADQKYPVLKKKDVQTLPKSSVQELFKNVKAMMIRKLSATLVNSTDNIIISAVLGLSATGITSNYVMLTSTLGVFLLQVLNGLTASIGNANVLESKEKNLKIFYIVNFLNFWLYGWSSVSFLVLADDIVGVAFGKQYILSFEICAIMAVNFYMSGMQNSLWVYRSTLGLFDQGKFLPLVTGVLNIILSIILGKVWGIFGILFATFVSRIFTNIWYEPYSVFRYGFFESSRRYFINYIKMALILVLTFVVTFGCCHLVMFNNDYIRLLLRFLICVFMPNLVIILFYHNSEEFKYLYKKFLDMIHHIKNRG